MEFITEVRKGSRLDALNREAVPVCEFVDAAIAYVADDRTLIQSCRKHNKKLTLWVRYDQSVPVRVDILKSFLDAGPTKIECKLIPDIFHPKIIWWHGFGAYIGSANLTDSAWFRNFEAGIFMPEEEMDANGTSDALELYFLEIDGASHPLTTEIYEKLRDWDKEKESLDLQIMSKFAKYRSIPKLESRTLIDTRPAISRKRESFLREWNETLTILHKLSDMVSDYRPRWMTGTPPRGAQVDRFLHAYYVQTVKENSELVSKLYSENKKDPDAAVQRALSQWRDAEEPPAHVKELLEEWLPLVQSYLKQDKLSNLTEVEFGDLCAHVHAFHDYAVRANWKSLGLSAPLEEMAAMERARLVGRLVFKQKSKRGLAPVELFKQVIYGGTHEDTPQRIFEAVFDENSKIRHIGLSTLGEMTGWVNPDLIPPRNDRTNKALRALGFTVRCRMDKAN